MRPTGRSPAGELEAVVGVVGLRKDAAEVPRVVVEGSGEVGPCVFPRPCRLECLKPPLCSLSVVLAVRVGQVERNLHVGSLHEQRSPEHLDCVCLPWFGRNDAAYGTKE